MWILIQFNDGTTQWVRGDHILRQDGVIVDIPQPVDEDIPQKEDSDGGSRPDSE